MVHVTTLLNQENYSRVVSRRFRESGLAVLPDVREGVESQRVYEEYGVIVCKFGPSRDEASRMYIELFVLVAFIGVFQRGLTSTLLTVIGLTGVTIIYLLWWRYYFRLAEIAGSELQFIKHTAYLYRANHLDLSIAAVTALLVSLHVRRAIFCFGSAEQIGGRERRAPEYSDA